MQTTSPPPPYHKNPSPPPTRQRRPSPSTPTINWPSFKKPTSLSATTPFTTRHSSPAPPLLPIPKPYNHRTPSTDSGTTTISAKTSYTEAIPPKTPASAPEVADRTPGKGDDERIPLQNIDYKTLKLARRAHSQAARDRIRRESEETDRVKAIAGMVRGWSATGGSSAGQRSGGERWRGPCRYDVFVDEWERGFLDGGVLGSVGEVV